MRTTVVGLLFLLETVLRASRVCAVLFLVVGVLFVVSVVRTLVAVVVFRGGWRSDVKASLMGAVINNMLTKIKNRIALIFVYSLILAREANNTFFLVQKFSTKVKYKTDIQIAGYTNIN